MADLTIEVCGYTTAISCGEGEEAHLMNLVNIVQKRAEIAEKIVGSDRMRQLIFAAIFLADEASAASGPLLQHQPAPDQTADMTAIADRFDAIAARLAALTS